MLHDSPDPLKMTVALVDESAPRHRSGAVARMVNMPVATLRVWERRYRVTTPFLTASGQRLYSAVEVRRIAQIKQLTELGHAIGSLAALDMAQLQAVRATHTNALAEATREVAPAASRGRADELQQSLRLIVVGAGLAARVVKPAVLRQLSCPPRIVGVFDSAAQAAASLRPDSADALLLQLNGLYPGSLRELQAAAPSLLDLPCAVVYTYACAAVCRQFTQAGLVLVRETNDDAVLGNWLRSVDRPDTSTPLASAFPVPPALDDLAVPARRWDDASLAEIAAMSSTIACECPRHVTELLTLLSRFEAYSTECEPLSAEHAQLHSYLRQVASRSRAAFEVALERIALQDGLLLPP